MIYCELWTAVRWSTVHDARPAKSNKSNVIAKENYIDKRSLRSPMKRGLRQLSTLRGGLLSQKSC